MSKNIFSTRVYLGQEFTVGKRNKSIEIKRRRDYVEGWAALANSEKIKPANKNIRSAQAARLSMGDKLGL